MAVVRRGAQARRSRSTASCCRAASRPARALALAAKHACSRASRSPVRLPLAGPVDHAAVGGAGAAAAVGDEEEEEGVVVEPGGLLPARVAGSTPLLTEPALCAQLLSF